MTPAGIEPATFRFVAQRLNHYATAVPLHTVSSICKYDDIADFCGVNDTIAIAFRMAIVLFCMSSKFTSCVEDLLQNINQTSGKTTSLYLSLYYGYDL